MRDTAKWLRHKVWLSNPGELKRVANEIERLCGEAAKLREENARLREALEEALPFVRIKGMWSEEIHDRIAAAIREGGKDG